MSDESESKPEVERRAEDRRSDERRADDRRSDERRADERRADDRRSDERRSDERRNNERRSDERRSDERRNNERRSDERRVNADKSSRFGPKTWIFLSFALSAVILGWAFTLPFRKHERPLLIWDESDIPQSGSNGVRKIRMKREEVEEYREDTLARDREFLRKHRDAQRTTGPLPDARDAEKKRAEHVKSIRATINSLKDAPEDSLEGKYRKALEASLKAPQ